ncbi:hypothetical protein M514_05540 [Trichuris suis]|nr:hypothetical protein M514_05540 [Trichuris suis]KHJ47041.1 hypothetical protein D918_02587 [Trichuris suis]
MVADSINVNVSFPPQHMHFYEILKQSQIALATLARSVCGRDSVSLIAWLVAIILQPLSFSSRSGPEVLA